MERTRPGSRAQFRNCEPRPLGCWAVQSHCSQVKKRTLRKEKGIFSLELKLALTINLLAVAGVTPQLLPCGAGARPQEAAAPAQARAAAPTAMALHPRDTAAVIFLLCRQEGGERPTRGSYRDHSLVSKSRKYRRAGTVSELWPPLLPFPPQTPSLSHGSALDPSINSSWKTSAS